MLTPSQYAAREGITRQAAMARLAHLTPKPKVARLRTKSGRTVARIQIDPQAVYTPGKPGPKGPRKDK